MRKIPSIFDKRQGLAAGPIQFKWLLLMACLWLISLSSQAAPWHAHEAIYQAVSQFSQQQRSFIETGLAVKGLGAAATNWEVR